MSFSCGCDSDLGVVDEYERPWTGHKTIKCRECGCELARGHIVHTTIMAQWGDEPSCRDRRGVVHRVGQ